jgi:hypothetical protein
VQVTGQPAMSVPLYWNEAGLPIGMHSLAVLVTKQPCSGWLVNWSRQDRGSIKRLRGIKPTNGIGRKKFRVGIFVPSRIFISINCQNILISRDTNIDILL